MMRGAERMPMKWQSLVLALVIVLTGCTSTFVYNRLDTLVAWYLEGLVTLDQRQRADLRQWLDETLDWHRDSELKRYAHFVRDLAQQSVNGADRTTFEQAENQFREFTANVARMLCSASGPIGSSSTLGRAPVRSRNASERSRSFSNPAA